MTDTAFSPKQTAEAARKAAAFFEAHPLERVQSMFAKRHNDGVQCFCAMGRLMFELNIKLRADGSGFEDIQYLDFLKAVEYAERVNIENINDGEPVTSEPPTATIAALNKLAAKLEAM